MVTQILGYLNFETFSKKGTKEKIREDWVDSGGKVNSYLRRKPYHPAWNSRRGKKGGESNDEE